MRKKSHKLSAEQVQDVLWFHRNTNISEEALGRRFKVSAATISKILQGKYRSIESYKNFKKRGQEYED